MSRSADSSPVRRGQVPGTRQTRSATGALLGQQDDSRPSERATWRRAEAEEPFSGGGGRASLNVAGRGPPARPVAVQAGGGNRRVPSGAAAKGKRRAGGAGGQDSEQEQESGGDELVHSIPRALAGGSGSATESLASLQDLLGRLVQNAQNEATVQRRTENLDHGQSLPLAAGRGGGTRQPAGRGRQGGAQQAPVGQLNRASFQSGGGQPDVLDASEWEQARAAAPVRPVAPGRGSGLQGRVQRPATTNNIGKGDSEASKKVAAEHRRAHDYLRARCVSTAIASTLSDGEAWDQTRRSIMFPNLAKTDKEMIRQAETILIWTGANLLEPSQWRSLPKHVVRYMCEKLDVIEKWVEPFGNGVTTESLREMFLAVSDTEGCAAEVCPAVTRAIRCEYAMVQVRDSDACRFLHNCADSEPQHNGNARVGKVQGKDKFNTPSFAENGAGEMHDDTLESWEEGPIVVDPGPGSLTAPHEPTVLELLQTEMEAAFAQAARGTGAGTRRYSHRKAGPKKRRRHDSESDSDSGWESDRPGPVRQVRRALQRAADAWGGAHMMTDEHRQVMPILTLPAHQVELDLARYYLDDERVSAFNICAAMTQDVRTKHRKAREKLLQDEQTGKAILDRRDPYQVVPAAPWHIAFRFIGDNPNVLQASLQWGEMLNVARMGFVMAKDGISPNAMAFSLARLEWNRFEPELQIPDRGVSDFKLQSFKNAVLLEFADRDRAVEGALTRMPTILAALRQQVKDLPEWFNKITSRVNAASASGGVGILDSVLGGASAASGPTLQALVVRNLFKPFFTGTPNVGASVVFGAVAPDSLRLQPGIMALLSGGFSSETRVGGAAQAITSTPAPSSALRALPPPPYAPRTPGTNWDNSSGGRLQTPRRNEQQFTHRQEPGASSREPERDQWRGAGPSLFRPMTAALVGLKIARIVSPASDYQCTNCTKPHHINGPHRSYECPSAYMTKYGEPCPGYDENGDILQRAWAADKVNIKDETKKEWTAYIRKHGLRSCAAELELGGVDFVNDRIGGLLANVAAKPSYRGPNRGWGGRR